MKIISITKYEAKDGNVFDTEEECLYHEKKGTLMELIESDVGFTEADTVFSFITDNRDSLLRIIAPRNLAEHVMIMSDLKLDQKFHIGKTLGYYFAEGSTGLIDLFHDSVVIDKSYAFRVMLEGKVDIWV